MKRHLVDPHVTAASLLALNSTATGQLFVRRKKEQFSMFLQVTVCLGVEEDTIKVSSAALNAKTRSPGVAFDDQHVLLLLRLLLFSFLAPLRAFSNFPVFP